MHCLVDSTSAVDPLRLNLQVGTEYRRTWIYTTRSINTKSNSPIDAAWRMARLVSLCRSHRTFLADAHGLASHVHKESIHTELLYFSIRVGTRS
jgi:hypothetical protein